MFSSHCTFWSWQGPPWPEQGSGSSSKAWKPGTLSGRLVGPAQCQTWTLAPVTRGAGGDLQRASCHLAPGASVCKAAPPTLKPSPSSAV